MRLRAAISSSASTAASSSADASGLMSSSTSCAWHQRQRHNTGRSEGRQMHPRCLVATRAQWLQLAASWTNPFPLPRPLNTNQHTCRMLALLRCTMHALSTEAAAA
jgi:hypothetical protein